MIIILALDKRLTLRRMDIVAKLGRSRFKRTMILAQGDESRAAGSPLSFSLSSSLSFRIARIEFIRLGPCARLVHQPVIINRAFLCAPSLPLDLNTLSYTRDATYRTGYLCYYTIARTKVADGRWEWGNLRLLDVHFRVAAPWSASCVC